MKNWFQTPFKVWMVIGSILFFVYFLIFLQTDNFARYGEAISFSGWLRTVAGKPYLSQANELPLGLNCYSPIFLLPLTLLAKLYTFPSLTWFSIVAKCYCLFLLCGLLYVLRQVLNELSFQKIPFALFFLAASFILFHSPDILLTLRPDLLSYLFDALGVLYVLRYLNGRGNRSFVLAALLSGLAVSVKLNTVGATIGILLFFAGRKEMGRSILYGSLALATFLVSVGTYYLFWKQATFDNLFSAVQSVILPIPTLLTVYRQVLELLFFPLLPFCFLTLLGLNALRAESPERASQTRLFAMILGMQFLLATLGQMKWGAYFNYYFGMLFLAVVPAAYGLAWVGRQVNPTLGRSVNVISFATLALFLARDIYTPLQIAREKDGFAPVAKFLKEQIPHGAVYTTSHNISVHLHDRVMLGAVSEELLATTPKLRRFQNELFKKMAQVDFKAAVIDTPGCASWKAPAYYLSSMGSLTHLAYQADGVCVFDSQSKH